MKTTKRGIPLASMEKIIRKSGANRVADSAKVELRKILQNHAEEISKKAALLARHAGRKTIKTEDIKLAAKETQLNF
jgi:histone H3/H4